MLVLLNTCMRVMKQRRRTDDELLFCFLSVHSSGLLVGVILRFGVHVPQNMNNVVPSCAVNATTSTLLVNVNGRFFEYILKGEVSRGNGHQVQDDEMLRKARPGLKKPMDGKECNDLQDRMNTPCPHFCIRI